MNYGATVKAEQLIQLLQHQFQRNRQLMQKARAGTPVCIWGAHGIGKTQIVRDFAKQNNWKCISLAPAQFEEMGDLLGMPQIEGNRTVFRKPAWAPEDFGPGILLLDDFNRADDRIIRGLMPLLQDGRTVSWGLPPDWHIVLTANPDNGDYSVTPLDASLLTRMLHVELTFDVKSWANWAANYRIPSLFIDFVLLYPELIDHERTTARSLVQFFDSLQGLDQTKKQKTLIPVLAKGFLGEAAARQFVAYLKSTQEHLPSVRTVLEANDFDSEVAQPVTSFLNKSTLQLEAFSVFWERIYRTLKNRPEDLKPQELKNLEKLLKLPQLPEDLRKYWVMQLLDLDQKNINEWITQGDWTKYLL